MRYLISMVIFLALALPTQAEEAAIGEVHAVLDDFHEAASQADAQRYFGHFADEAVFLGTDVTERWSLDQFKAYALPSFRKGQGWTYKPVSRHVFVSSDGKTAWFDEILAHERYATGRGTR